MLAGAIFIALLFGLTLYLILIYNNLVALKNNISRNWSNIDVLLKQRYSELPKLIDTCKEYMKYEQETLQKIVNARQSAISATNAQDVVALGQAESALKSGLSRLFALSENYPDLKANQAFNQLQTRITQLENDIADRRELYNESVNLNNIRIQQIPDVFIARVCNFTAAKLLTFSAEEIQDVAVDQQFKG